jgi:hypothetical protein
LVTNDPLKPTPTLLIKLGSILVHFEEVSSPGGHPLDMVALQGLIDDPEVKAWRAEMDKKALLPVKR